MDDRQRYLFDLNGFLHIPALLASDQASALLAASERLERRVAGRWPVLPHRRGWMGMEGRVDPDDGIYIYGGGGPGGTWVVEDFWNADPTFHLLLDHAPTLAITRATIRGRVTVNNAELRVRYPGNHTGAHMGGPIDAKYAYRHDARGFDCMMTRMIYLLHDVGPDDGPFCVVPGSHKAAYPPPGAALPEEEPGMIAITGKAGDAIYFTEALRHGGFVNRGSRTRRTLHVGYGPAWLRSQHFGSMDEPQVVGERAWAALTGAQRELFLPLPEGDRPLPATPRAEALAAH
ncbi:MAG: phytanoyl-CoA dioxygenase family protein [Planctomycetes bacterium]|nr:phytanoyl-CoA dioxygenase family protein [Planctomycetota bacterium]